MQIISVKEAVALIKDGTTVAATGFTGCAIPEYILREVEESFLSTGKPNGLTFVWDNAVADGSGRGSDHLGHEGLVQYSITSHLNLMPKMQKLVDSGKIRAHVLPLGCIVELYREIGRGSPGLISRIGLGTYVDPRISGGKANPATTDDLVELMEIHGEEYLFYNSFPIDVAIIRGTTIDTHGNLSLERELVLTAAYSVAQAVKRSGGIVIAQVEGVCEYGSLKPRNVEVPGIMIDYAVVSPAEFHPMTLQEPKYNPALGHEYRVELHGMPSLPMSERKIIARRSALELIEGSIVNLGFGIPEGIASVAAEAGIIDKLTLTVESGHVGGMPNGGPIFGSCYNPDFVLDATRMMDWYEGGALDLGFLGCVEVDRKGNVNVTKIGKTIGPGGFINIAHTAKKVRFCGTMTAGSLDVAVEDGKLIIRNEGKIKKFVPEVEQISFSGATAVREQQDVLYITERAVFRLTPEGLVLIEIAPGIDLQTQVIDQVDFELKVSPELKLMDERIFRPEPMLL